MNEKYYIGATLYNVEERMSPMVIFGIIVICMTIIGVLCLLLILEEEEDNYKKVNRTIKYTIISSNDDVVFVKRFGRKKLIKISDLSDTHFVI
jgi:hypothetical protein